MPGSTRGRLGQSMKCCAARPSGASRPRPRAAAVAAAQACADDDCSTADAGQRTRFSYPHTAVADTFQPHARESHDPRKVEGEQRAAVRRGRNVQIPAQQPRLDLDVGAWLEAQNEALPITRAGSPKERALADVLRTELQVNTLRDLIGTIQHPADWASIIPADPDRCQRLWLALLREVDLLKASMPEGQTKDVPAWFETLRYETFGFIAVSIFAMLGGSLASQC